MWYPGEIKIGWSSKSENFTHANQFIFLALPWILLLFIFIFRKSLREKFSANTKNWIYTSIGTFMIIWELWFDIYSIIESSLPREDAVWNQFVAAFDFCRLNMYIIGVFLIFRKIELVKWTTATALFGGYSTMVNHYDGEANIHSLGTHAVILAAVPALTVTMEGSNYKTRNLIHAHLFNWLLVAIMYMSNVMWDGVAGELTPQRMSDNVMVGWAPWPVNMFLWILSVMIMEWIYFGIFRLVFLKTYQKDTKFIDAIKLEYPKDKKEWYGFKLWGKDSYYIRKKEKWKKHLSR